MEYQKVQYNKPMLHNTTNQPSSRVGKNYNDCGTWNTNSQIEFKTIILK